MCNLFIQNLTARGNGEWGMGDFSTRSLYGARKKSAHRVNRTLSLSVWRGAFPDLYGSGKGFGGVNGQWKMGH